MGYLGGSPHGDVGEDPAHLPPHGLLGVAQVLAGQVQEAGLDQGIDLLLARVGNVADYPDRRQIDLR